MIAYGIQPPQDVPAAWGCRAIQQYTFLDIVPDRQDMCGDKNMMEALQALINLDDVRAAYKKAYCEGKLAAHEAGEVVLIDNEHIKVVADTKGSHGYVYLGAHLKAHVESDRLPVAGAIVTAKVNNIGKVKVLYHTVVKADKESFPMAVAMPLDPPEWYRKQNAWGHKWKACHLVPNEMQS